MNNIIQLFPSSFSIPMIGTGRLSNRYVLAAIAALALVAVTYAVLRTFAPNLLSRFSFSHQQTPTTVPAPTSGSATTPTPAPTPTPATPAPISTLTQTQNTTSLNGEELPLDALSKALLIDLYDVTLLQNEEEKQKLIVEARGFADTVRTESNHDARMNNGPVPRPNGLTITHIFFLSITIFILTRTYIYVFMLLKSS